jgi:cytoskeletal protein CcmA (bactofilin family)
VFKRRKPDEPQGNTPQPADPASPADGPLHPGLRGDPAGGSARPDDFGLGVPPFRPAPPKETPAMGRAPFPGTPVSPTPASLHTSQPRPAGLMPALQPAERRTLVVGRGISLQGVVQDAERLVVEGTVEATMIHATELVIASGGMFRGEVEVEDAEIAGTIDGTLVARGNLVVRASGRVLGTARCRRLQVEDGGQITGRIEMISEPAGPAVEPGA